MAVPQGRLIFAGYDADAGFQVSRTASVVADPIQAKFILGVDLPRYGNIRISYGNSFITLANCRVVRQTITQGSNGRYKDVQFEDRRWAWRFKNIYGQYNTYIRGVKKSAKNARQLATLCLQAMGEVGVDVSVLPDDVFPLAEFGGQLASEQLETLIQPFGVIVSLGMDDRVYLRKIGSGRNPPNDQRIMDFTTAYEPPVIPETLRVEGAPIMFQRDLPLEAVGYEIDTFEVKPLAKLSYCPTVDGQKTFAFCSYDFRQLADPKKIEIAQSCVWKLYRVQGKRGKSLKIPTPTGLRLPANTWSAQLLDNVDVERIIPLSSNQLKLWSEYEGIVPAEIIGYFHDLRPSQLNNVTPIPANGPNPLFNADHYASAQGDYLRLTFPEHVYHGSFEIYEEKGLVKFGVQCYSIKRTGKVVAADKFQPAKILLRTSFIVRDPTTNEPIRQFYDYKPNSRYVSRGVTHTIRVDALEYECGVADSRGLHQTEVSKFEYQARKYALKEIAKYDLGESVSVPAKGFLFDYSPDGSISSIRLERADSGECTTTVDWQSENPIDRLTYDEKVLRLQELANNKFIANQKDVLAKAQARREARKVR